MNPGFLITLALIFMGLLALRVLILLILRHSETPKNPGKPHWPDATIIQNHDTPPHENQT